jgi:PRTRC genetic system ThiF family protein
MFFLEAVMANKFFLPSEWNSDQPLKVVLVGVGGNGSEVLDSLARMHFGLRALEHPGLAVTTYDADDVSLANIGRQRFAPGDVGTNKAIAITNRFNLFFGLNWDAEPYFFEADMVSDLDADLLITCVDKAKCRADIGLSANNGHSNRYRRQRTLWLDVGNDRIDGQAILGDLFPQGKELPNVFDLYGELTNAVEDTNTPSCSLAEAIQFQDLFVNKFAALGIGMIWTLLTKGELEHHGYFFNSAACTMNPLLIDLQTWAFMGFEPKKAAA